MCAWPAFAAGLGLEVGGGYTTAGPTADLAVDARIPSESFGSLEIRARGLTYFQSDGFGLGVMLLPRYRTPYANFGPFAFTVAGGIGALGIGGCNKDNECGFGGAGPVIEVSPTLSLRTRDDLQPYVTINGLVASLWETGSRVFLGANLAIGIAFDFSGKPAKKIPDDQPMLPAVTTEPIQPATGQPASTPMPSPTIVPTTPITPPQDVKPAPVSPSSKLMPKNPEEEEEPANLPPPALTPASAPATTPSP